VPRATFGTSCNKRRGVLVHRSEVLMIRPADGLWVRVCMAMLLAAPAVAVAEGKQERWEALLAGGVEEGMAGVAVIADRGGRVLFAGASGLADVERGEALTLDHAIHLASVTKQFTAAAVLALVERDRLRLDAPIVEHLGRERLAGLAHAEEVTVGQLLDHSSGFYPTNNDPDYLEAWLGAGAGGSARWTADDFIRLASRRPPAAPPGQGRHYGDLNYILLAEIVEAVTGAPYRDHVRSTLFEPLGLRSAYFFSEVPWGEEPPPGTAEGYLVLSEVIAEIVDLNDAFPRLGDGRVRATAAGERIDGAGAIVASTRDLHRFASAYFRGAVLGERSRRLVFSVAEELDGETEEIQGILVALRTKVGTMLVAEGDGPGGSHCLMAFHPESDTLLVGLVNTFGLWSEADFLRELAVEAVVRGRTLD
jgi:D-alanyl-D-alanine carboxypeptidase